MSYNECFGGGGALGKQLHRESVMSRAEWKDYSLTGPESVRAVERGLAGAVWYSPPVPQEKMRALRERRNGPAIRDTLLWFGLLICFGILAFLLWGSYWAILPLLAYGVIYGSTSDSRWHEPLHGTAFRTDWLNAALYEVASFMVQRESTPWRWSHMRHHSDTIIVGRDREIAVPRPPQLGTLLGNFIGLKNMRFYYRNVLRHCLGRLDPEERCYIPVEEHAKVYFKARIYFLIYASTIALAACTRSLLPLVYVGLPNLYGTWLMVIYGYTQHAGLAENVLDHRLNCRTVYMNPVNRYLYWNMNYHLEHHMFPLVPYYNLPALHAVVKETFAQALRRPAGGMPRDHSDRCSGSGKTPTYYVQRQLPSPAAAPPRRAEASPAIVSRDRPTVDGWVEVCAGRLRWKGKACCASTTTARRSPSTGRPTATITPPTASARTSNSHLADGLVDRQPDRVPQAQRPLRRPRRLAARPPACVAAADLSGDGARRKTVPRTSARPAAARATETAYEFRVVEQPASSPPSSRSWCSSPPTRRRRFGISRATICSSKSPPMRRSLSRHFVCPRRTRASGTRQHVLRP